MTETILAPVAANHQRILLGQQVPMRDNTKLRTDVYLPASPDSAAAVLIRSPYGIRKGMYLRMGKKLSDAGFCVILQEMRCFTQDTANTSLDQGEAEDCYDTLAWLATRDWCNGTVGFFGISISAFSAFRAYDGPVPEGIHLTGITSLGGIISPASCLFPGGALRLHWFLPWSAMMDPHIGMREQGGNNSWHSLPWSQLLGPNYRESIAKLDAKPMLWRRFENDGLEQLQAPPTTYVPSRQKAQAGLLISGFYDAFLDETLMAYQRLNDAAKAQVNLIIGPWDHQSLFFSLAGVAIPPGPCTETQPLDIMQVVTHWFAERHQQKSRLPFSLPPVLVFLQSRQIWLEGTSFPLPGTQCTRWYLAAGDSEAHSARSGMLSPYRATEKGSARFVSNVTDPVPTNGGALWAFGNRWATGPLQQPHFGRRNDVPTFTTEVLPTALAVIGVVELEVWVGSAEPSADFAVKLVEVAPTGEATLVQDGILRTKRPDGYGPNDPFLIRVNIGACAHIFAAGGRIGLEIAGSNFPKYETHPFSGSLSDQMVQTVFYGPNHRSSLLLPVVDLATQKAWRDPAFLITKRQAEIPGGAPPH